MSGLSNLSSNKQNSNYFSFISTKTEFNDDIYDDNDGNVEDFDWE